MNDPNCPFCTPNPTRVFASSEHAVAVWDAFPLTEGHVLVVPRRHLACLFDATPEEIADVWKLVGVVRDRLNDTYGPDGFNIGLNDGESAGQTVMHAHVHVIPRRIGDVEDPRGGVRYVIPERARYWGGEERS